MRIEIFVVTTEIDKKLSGNDRTAFAEATMKKSELIWVRNELIRHFGGLTAIPNAKGYWINECGACETDNTEIWLIYVNHPENIAILKTFTKQIKKLTSQKSQAYGIDGKMYYC